MKPFAQERMANEIKRGPSVCMDTLAHKHHQQIVSISMALTQRIEADKHSAHCCRHKHKWPTSFMRSSAFLNCFRLLSACLVLPPAFSGALAPAPPPEPLSPPPIAPPPARAPSSTAAFPGAQGAQLGRQQLLKMVVVAGCTRSEPFGMVATQPRTKAMDEPLSLSSSEPGYLVKAQEGARQQRARG